MTAFRRQSDVLLEEAWNWLIDVGVLTEDDEELVHEGTITAAEVIGNVDRLYDRGWYQFQEDHRELEVWTVFARSTIEGRTRVTEKSNFGNTRTR